ncbi:MAG: UvrD-helicase domain-containing protein, partial [Thermaurantiacus sp.]
MSELTDFQTAYAAAIKAQADAADPSCSAYATANAGSGKTKVLIDRVARLLLRRPDGRPGAAPDSILCITYTRAAANEMLTRLFQTLGSWAVMEDDSLRAALGKLEGRGPATYDAEDLRKARALFARALETPGGLRIETIHAF